MNMKNLKKQLGLSLLEVLIALVISLVILLGVISVLTNSSLAYRMQDGLMRLQGNAQFAMEFLAKDLRNTGFWGCVGGVDDVNNQLDVNPTLTFYDFSKSIEGEQSNGGGVIKANDSLTVSGVNSIKGDAAVQAPYGPLTSSPIQINSGSGLASGDIVFVGDCEQGDIFQVTSIASGKIGHNAGGGSPGNLTNNVSKVYDGKAHVYKTYKHLYDIQLDAKGNPGLYVTTSQGKQELVPDVEGMVILYGEDNDADGSANLYVRADSVTDMDNVVSLRVSLLLRSRENNLSPQSQTYTFNVETTAILLF